MNWSPGKEGHLQVASKDTEEVKGIVHIFKSVNHSGSIVEAARARNKIRCGRFEGIECHVEVVKALL